MNFRPTKNPVTHRQEPPAPTKAEAIGLSPPPLSPEQKAGQRANAFVVAQQQADKLAALEQFKRERAEYEKAREDAIWARVQARQAAL
jgi:hypothetical protein